MPRSAHKTPRSAPAASGRRLAPSVRAEPDKLRQHLRLGALVGVSMLAITAFYALTLRYQDFGSSPDELPRWSMLSEGVVTRAMPLKTTLLGVKDALKNITSAHRAQSAALAALKAKIESATAPDSL